VSGFGYLVFSLPAPSESFAHLIYLLLKSWFLSHSLLKFLEQAEPADGDVRQRGGDLESLYTCCSAAQLDRRSSGKSRVVGFSVTFGFATDIIVRDDSEYLPAQQCTQDYLELTESSRALRKLNARRLGKGGTLGRPSRRSSFLGRLRKLFFRHRMIIKQFWREYTAIDKSHETDANSGALITYLHKKSVVPIVQNVQIANACCGQFQTFQSFNSLSNLGFTH